MPGRAYVFLTHGEVWSLAKEAGSLINLLAYTGLRWGEATALRVCDVDLARLRVDVRRAYSDVGGRLVVGSPKSHQSRTVPLPGFLADELADLTYGTRLDDLVVTSPGGHPLRLTNWRRNIFTPACRRAQISERFRLHDLRHTAASLMIQAGYPPKKLQVIMGHASITTTLDLYGHLFLDDMDRYAKLLDMAVEQTRTANTRPNDREDPPAAAGGCS